MKPKALQYEQLQYKGCVYSCICQNRAPTIPLIDFEARHHVEAIVPYFEMKCTFIVLYPGMWQLTHFLHFLWGHFCVITSCRFVLDSSQTHWLCLVKNVFCATLFRFDVQWNLLCCLIFNLIFKCIHVYHILPYLSSPEKPSHPFFFSSNDKWLYCSPSCKIQKCWQSEAQYIIK